jgi:hypothetical protein
VLVVKALIFMGGEGYKSEGLSITMDSFSSGIPESGLILLNTFFMSLLLFFKTAAVFVGLS